MVTIRQLVWDDWNITHIARHNVFRREVEQAYRGKHVIRKSHSERLLLIGQTTQRRTLAVVLAQKEQGTYYVVTARTADRKERRIYHEELKKGGAKAA